MMSWTFNVPMTHATRTLYSILVSMAEPSGRIEVDDERLRALVGLSSGSGRPISDGSLYRLRNELMSLDMLQAENVYDTTPKMGSPRVIRRRYLVRLEPPSHIKNTFPSDETAAGR